MICVSRNPSVAVVQIEYCFGVFHRKDSVARGACIHLCVRLIAVRLKRMSSGFKSETARSPKASARKTMSGLAMFLMQNLDYSLALIPNLVSFSTVLSRNLASGSIRPIRLPLNTVASILKLMQISVHTSAC